MNKNLRKSPLLEKLHAHKDPFETGRVQTSMMLSAKIVEALKAKGWTKGQLANALGKSPSIITRWLSGTHNFTSDTLSDIEQVLSVQLLARPNEAQPSVTDLYEGDTPVTNQSGVSAQLHVHGERYEWSMASFQPGTSFTPPKLISEFRNFLVAGHQISHLTFPTFSNYVFMLREDVNQFVFQSPKHEFILYGKMSREVGTTMGQIGHIKKKDIEEDLCYS